MENKKISYFSIACAVCIGNLLSVFIFFLFSILLGQNILRLFS